MNRYEEMFNKLYLLKEGCLTAFVIIGDPSLKESVKIIETLIDNGVNALELGIPFSDPLSDGPIIQKANIRALSNKYNFLKYFLTIKKIRKKYPNIPIGILIYANLVFSQGINNFYLKCFESNIDSVLIVDVPIEEYDFFYKIANKYNINSIFICPPNANNNFLTKLSLYATGYIYLLSRPGVTGIKNEKKFISHKFIKKIKKYTSLPLLQGFGITNAQQVKTSLISGTHGVICGSSIINIIEKNLKDQKNMIFQIKQFILKLKKSTKYLTINR